MRDGEALLLATLRDESRDTKVMGVVMQRVAGSANVRHAPCTMHRASYMVHQRVAWVACRHSEAYTDLYEARDGGVDRCGCRLGVDTSDIR